MPFNGKLLSGADKKRKDQKIKILNYHNVQFSDMINFILKNGYVVTTNIQTSEMSNI